MVIVLLEHWIRLYTSGIRRIPTAPDSEKASPTTASAMTMISLTAALAPDSATRQLLQGS